MSKYIITGEWKSDGIKFYGEWFTRVEAVLPSVQDPKDVKKRSIVTTYLPENLAGSGNAIEDDEYRELVELELAPGMIIMRLVPYSIIVGDPSSLSRPLILCVEDVAVDGSSMKTLAIPAS